MPRSESLAYANTQKNSMSRILYFFRSHSTAFTASVGFLVFILLVTSDMMLGGDGQPNLRAGMRNKMSSIANSWGGAIHSGYFKMEDSILSENTYAFAAVTDMDELSRKEGEKPIFHSFILSGTIVYDPSTKRYTHSIDGKREIISGHNEAGRGMELSELTLYNDRLLAFDDRTGSVFEILSQSEEESFVVPRFVITEGDGDTDKGMKWEWATVKDGKLYIGSMGKEYTDREGNIVNTNNLWIATVDEDGNVQRIDWRDNYDFVRSQLNASPPGYVIHEAVLWSEQLKKWIFIPRRVSSEMYDDVKDEKMGTNKVLLVNEKFTESTLVELEMEVDPLHGFSTAAFVPNTNEKHIMAIRSVEEDCVGGDPEQCKQRSYLIIFDVTTGKVLLDEVEIDNEMKFEGVEFVNIRALPE